MRKYRGVWGWWEEVSRAIYIHMQIGIYLFGQQRARWVRESVHAICLPKPFGEPCMLDGVYWHKSNDNYICWENYWLVNMEMLRST